METASFSRQYRLGGMFKLLSRLRKLSIEDYPLDQTAKKNKQLFNQSTAFFLFLNASSHRQTWTVFLIIENVQKLRAESPM